MVENCKYTESKLGLSATSQFDKQIETPWKLTFNLSLQDSLQHQNRKSDDSGKKIPTEDFNDCANFRGGRVKTSLHCCRERKGRHNMRDSYQSDLLDCKSHYPPAYYTCSSR